MGLGDNIRRLRTERKMSQEYLAEQLYVSRQAVSKWENGQTEPTAKNLVELARLFNISVSELVEPEKLPNTKQDGQNSILKQNLEVVAVGSYTGFAILSTVQTNDPGFYVYAAVLTFLAGCVMAYNIFRLPRQYRVKTALKELVYCVLVWILVTFLPGKIGNVYTGILVIVLCIVYAVYIRFPQYRKKREKDGTF